MKSGWPVYKLKEVTRIVAGATPDTRRPEHFQGPIPWATPKDLSRLHGTYLETTEKRISREGFDSCSTKMLPAGSVLFSSRAPIGLVAIAGCDICTNQGFKSFICGEKVDPLYLFYYLRKITPEIQHLGRGATFKEVSAEIVGNVTMPLPPIDEQKRIAGILQQTELLLAKRRQTIALADEFLKSAFLDLFGDPLTNPKKWPTCVIGDVVAWSEYGLSNKSNHEGIGIPILGMSNLNDNGEIDTTRVSYVDISDEEFQRYKLQIGDVLFNRTNSTELVGKTACWRGGMDAVIASYLVRLRLNDNCDQVWFTALLNTTHCKSLFRSRCKKAVGQSNISPTLLKQFPMYLPPLELQKKYVNIADRIITQKSRQCASEQELQNLFAALLHRAFMVP